MNKNKISTGLHLGNDLWGRRKYHEYVMIHVYLMGMGASPRKFLYFKLWLWIIALSNIMYSYDVQARPDML